METPGEVYVVLVVWRPLVKSDVVLEVSRPLVKSDVVLEVSETRGMETPGEV